jgi:hypothetical protein
MDCFLSLTEAVLPNIDSCPEPYYNHFLDLEKISMILKSKNLTENSFQDKNIENEALHDQ